MHGPIRGTAVIGLAATLLIGGAPAAMAASGPAAGRATHARVGKPALSWAEPVKIRYRVSLPYGVRGPWLAGHHTGIDLAVPSGTPVYSVGSGTVVLARRAGAYGKAVTIRMPNGYYTLFGHLSVISVRPGQQVTAGTRIGYSGATGHATGPHLHFEVRAHRGYGSDISPVTYLNHYGVRLIHG
jgi:murein DD-endopeptidase MepM/ murein hydrolase activator NlpD